MLRNGHWLATGTAEADTSARRGLKLPHRRAETDFECDDMAVRGPTDRLVVTQVLRGNPRASSRPRASMALGTSESGLT